MTSQLQGTPPRWRQAVAGVSTHVAHLHAELERLSREAANSAREIEVRETAYRSAIAQRDDCLEAMDQVRQHLHETMKSEAIDPPAPSPGTPGTHSGWTRAAIDALATQRRDHDDATESVLIALARSWQTSAHQMQQLADELVRQYPDNGEILERAMRIAHLSAQQARKAQSVTILCGEWPGQQWPDPLSLADVVRAAASRITAYQRIRPGAYPPVEVTSHVVEPLIHLIAELLDNAAQTSAPTTPIPVTFKKVYRGWAIEIEDDGVGLDTDRLEWARERISGRRQLDLDELGVPPQTGLAVVGTLRRRHGFHVDFTESVYGGVKAVVVVPEEFIGIGHVEPSSTEERPTLLPPADDPAAELAAAGAEHDTVIDLQPEYSPQEDDTGLPRRRSRRNTPNEPSWPPPGTVARSTPAPAQSPEEAGAWAGQFFQVGTESEQGEAGR